MRSLAINCPALIARPRFNGWGVTLLDSMDTMWMMGLHAEFADAVRVVAGLNFTMRAVRSIWSPAHDEC